MVFRRKGGKPTVIDGTKEPEGPPPQPQQVKPTMRRGHKTEVIDATDYVPPDPATLAARAAASIATAQTPQTPQGGMTPPRRPKVEVQDFTSEGTPKIEKAEMLVEFVHVSNKLKKKVGEGATAFDPGVFIRAAEVVKNLSSSYIDSIAPKEMRDLNYIWQALQHFPEKSGENIAKLFTQAHEVKSGGGSYGYPLISRVAESLCKLTEGLNAPEEMDLALIRMHTDALNIVVRKKIKGMGGEIGQLLAEGLEVVVAKRKSHDKSLVLEHITSFLDKLDSA